VIESLRRLAVRIFASVANDTVPSTRCTILVPAVATTRMVSPLGRPQVSPPSPRSLSRSLGAIRKAYVKGKIASKSKKCKRCKYDSSSSSNSE
jgi:hypothetical protein